MASQTPTNKPGYQIIKVNDPKLASDWVILRFIRLGGPQGGYPSFDTQEIKRAEARNIVDDFVLQGIATFKGLPL